MLDFQDRTFPLHYFYKLFPPTAMEQFAPLTAVDLSTVPKTAPMPPRRSDRKRCAPPAFNHMEGTSDHSTKRRKLTGPSNPSTSYHSPTVDATLKCGVLGDMPAVQSLAAISEVTSTPNSIPQSTISHTIDLLPTRAFQLIDSNPTTKPAIISEPNRHHSKMSPDLDTSTNNTFEDSYRHGSKRGIPESYLSTYGQVLEGPSPKRRKVEDATSAPSFAVVRDRFSFTNDITLQDLNEVKWPATADSGPTEIVGHKLTAASSDFVIHGTIVGDEMSPLATTSEPNEPESFAGHTTNRIIAKPKSKKVRFLDTVLESGSAPSNLVESTTPHEIAATPLPIPAQTTSDQPANTSVSTPGSASVSRINNAQYQLPACFFPPAPKKRKDPQAAYAELNHFLPPPRKLRKGSKLSPQYDLMAVENIDQLRKNWDWSYLSRKSKVADITETIKVFEEELKNALKRLSKASTSRKNLGSYLREMTLWAARLSRRMRRTQIFGDEKDLLKQLRAWCTRAQSDREMIQGWVDTFGIWRD